MPRRRRNAIHRALRIVLRTAHIACAVGTLGAAMYGADAGMWPAALAMSGCGLAVDDFHREGLDWLRYLQGQAALLKLALVTLGAAMPSLLLPCLWGALIVGALISHAPGRVRHAALWGPPGPCALRDSAGVRAAGISAERAPPAPPRTCPPETTAG